MGIAKLLGDKAEYIIISGATIFYILLAIAIYLHPGFDLFSPGQSLSDLGKLGQSNNYIFNSAIIIAGSIFMLGTYAYYIKVGDDTYKKIALWVFFVALIMYINIGIFPKGTPYHNFFAKSFFLISSIAILIWAFSECSTGSKILAGSIILLTIISYLFGYYYEIVGFAFAELFAGTVIILWLLVFHIAPRKKFNTAQQ